MPRDGEPLSRRFLRLTALNVLANLTVPLAGLVDTAMLGHLPDIRFLAGVALGTVLFDYVYWSFGFLRMGTTGTTAQAIGRGDQAEGDRILYRSLLLAAGLGAAVLLLSIPLREAGFALLSGEAGVKAAGRQYFDARIWGAPAALCNFVLIGWYLGREESRRALWMTVAANLTNVGLNYVFIVRMGLAARGAGLASMLGQYVMLAVGLRLFLRTPGRASWRAREVLVRRRFVVLVRLNLDILARTACLVTVFAAFVNLGSALGVGVLAANTLLVRLQGLAAYVIDGAAFAAESLAGVFRGQGDTRSLRRLFRLSLASGAAISGAFLAGLFLAPRAVLGLLTSHGDVVQDALRHAGWLVPVLLLGALAFIYDGLFLGLTEGRTLRNAMLLSALVGFVPLAWIALARGDNHLLWAAMATFMLARTATLAAASRPLLSPGTRTHRR